jgi:putative membrane protein
MQAPPTSSLDFRHFPKEASASGTYEENIYMNRQRKNYVTGFLALACVVTSSSAFAADPQAQSKLSGQEKNFVMEAARSSMAEKELSDLAEQKARNESVKDLAKEIKSEHTQVVDKLQQIASNNNVSLPSDVSKSDRTIIDRLQKLSGEEFDKEYMKQTVKEHQKDVENYRQQARSAKDQEVKDYAQNTLPTLEQHLDRARQVSESIGVKTTGTSAQQVERHMGQTNQ